MDNSVKERGETNDNFIFRLISERDALKAEVSRLTADNTALKTEVEQHKDTNINNVLNAGVEISDLKAEVERLTKVCDGLEDALDESNESMADLASGKAFQDVIQERDVARQELAEARKYIETNCQNRCDNSLIHQDCPSKTTCKDVPFLKSPTGEKGGGG